MKYIIILLACLTGNLTAQVTTNTKTNTKTKTITHTDADGHHSWNYHYDSNSNNDCQVRYETKEYKVKHTGGTMKIVGGGTIHVETHKGNEVVFATEVEIIAEAHSDRSKGLKVLDAEALVDNSGLGFSIKKEGKDLIVERIITGHCDCEPIFIKLPKGIALEIKDASHFGEYIEVIDFNESLEIDVMHQTIKLKKVTGPMAIKTLHGSVEATFTSLSQEASISMIAVHSFVDVSIPANSKVTFDLKTQHGEIYTDLDINIAKSTEKKNSWDPKKINGTLNGGGVKMALNSNYGEVYIRKI